MIKLFKKILDLLDYVFFSLVSPTVKAERFVIITNARSGSNLLVSLLNKHPSIICHSEIYSREAIFLAAKYQYFKSKSKFFVFVRDRFSRMFIVLVWLFSRRAKVVGFKYFLDQTRRIEKCVLLNPEVKKIILKRRNILRMEISRQIAMKTQVWVSFDERRELTAIRFDIEQFWDQADLCKKSGNEMEAKIVEEGQCFCEVYYEDLMGSKAKESLDKIFDFLGLRKHLIDTDKISMKKQNPFPVKEIVENYEELSASLSGTEFEWMLNSE